MTRKPFLKDLKTPEVDNTGKMIVELVVFEISDSVFDDINFERIQYQSNFSLDR